MARKRIGYGDFYCGNCGTPMEKNTEICTHCQQPYDLMARCGTVDPHGTGGIGWSAEIENPCFRKTNKKNTFGTFIFLFIVCAIIFLVMLITGDISLSKEGFLLFGAVMAVLWTFWLLWMLFDRLPRKDWEGNVIKKEQAVHEYTRKDDEGYRHRETQTVYTVYFRTTAGKQKKITEYNRCIWYDYLQEGDIIRYHGKRMHYYEKYDKSKDIIIPCASCGARRDTRENYCGGCGCILLKGQPVAAPLPTSNLRFCPQCGTKAISGQNFCQECGTIIQNQS